MINVSNQKKYEILESDFIDYENKKLYRIVSKISDSDLRINEGDLGGYIEGYHNLSQEGRCWIYFGSIACGESEVRDNAILGNPDMLEISELLYDSQIDRATCGVILKESSKVMGNSIIDTVNCEISGTTKIHGGVYLINEELTSDRNRYKYCKSINLDDNLLKRYFPRLFDDDSDPLTLLNESKKRKSYRSKREKIFNKDVSKVLILGNSEIGDPKLDGTGYSSTLKSAVENDSFVLISGKSVVIDNCTINGKVSIDCAVIIDSEIFGENKGILYNKMSHIAINRAIPKKKKYITELKNGINSVSRGAINSLSFLLLNDDKEKMTDRTDSTLNISMFNLSEGLSKLLNTYYEDIRIANKEASKKDDVEDFLFSELYSNDSQSSLIFRVTGYINSTMGVRISMPENNTKNEIELLYDFSKSLKKFSNADRLIKAFTKKLGESVNSTSFKYNEISVHLLSTVLRNIPSYSAKLSVELDDELIHKAIESVFKRSQQSYYGRYYDNNGSFLFPAIVLNSNIKGNNIHIDPGYYEGVMIIDSTITGSVELTRSIVIKSKVDCNIESVYVNSSVPGYKRNNYKPNICGDYWGEPLNRLCNLIGDNDYVSPLDIYADVVMDSSQISQISIVNDDDESEVTEVHNYLFESIILDSELVGAMYIGYSVVHESKIYSNGKIRYFRELFDKLRKDYANKDENEKKSNVIEDVLVFHGRETNDYVSSSFLDPCIITGTYFLDKFAYENRVVVKNSVVIDSSMVDSSIASVILKESNLNHTYLSTRQGLHYGASAMRINKSTINDTLLYSGKGLYQIPVGYSGVFYGKGIVIDINDSNISNSKICMNSMIPAGDKYRKFIFTMINSSIYNSILQLTGGKLLESNELDQCHYFKEAKELGILKFINRNKAYMNMAFNLIDRNIINLNKQHISSRSIDSKVRLKSNGSAKFSADIIKDIILSRKLRRKESLEELLNITRKKEANNG